MSAVMDRTGGFAVAGIVGVYLILSALMPSLACGQQVIAGYYASFNADSLPYNAVEYDNLTHINVAFAYPNADGSLGFSAPGFPFSGLVSAAHAAGVKVLLSLGGAANSTNFPAATSDSAALSRFVSNVVAFVDTNHYDGVDVDWEVPADSQETNQLTSLVGELRARFDGLDSFFLITMAVPPTDYGGRHFDFERLTPYVDWFNAMCYDFYGSWSGYSGHNSPLYQSPADPTEAGSDSVAVLYLTSRSVPRHKIVLGIPFYGVQFNSPGLYRKLLNSSTSNPRYSDEMNDIASGWVYHWDSTSAVPYLTSTDGTRLVTFEDTNSVRLKVGFSRRQNLRGIMMWELSQDIYNGRQPLLEAISDEAGKMSGGIPTRTPAADSVRIGNYPDHFNLGTVIKHRPSDPGRVPEEALTREK